MSIVPIAAQLMRVVIGMMMVEPSLLIGMGEGPHGGMMIAVGRSPVRDMMGGLNHFGESGGMSAHTVAIMSFILFLVTQLALLQEQFRSVKLTMHLRVWKRERKKRR